MSTIHRATKARSDAQFDLLSLFEFVTLCSILLAFSAILGITTSVLLMLMALAIWTRQGRLALTMFIAAVLASDIRMYSPEENWFLARHALVVLLGTLLPAWYQLRRKWSEMG